MFLIKLIRFICGYVVFSIEGGFSERFINLCSVYDVPLWDVQSKADGFIACTTAQGYKKIRICCKKSGVKARIKKLKGFPFYLIRLKKRSGLLIGAMFFVICLAFLSSRVWLIEVEGNSKTPDDIIISVVEEAGLKCGKASAKINIPQITLKTVDKLASLSWVSVNLNGCVAKISVREAPDKPKLITAEGKEPRNIISSKDAQLISLEAYAGTAQAKAFNSVMKGDILISGVNQNRDETVSFVAADGYAVGRTQTFITAKASADEKIFKSEHIKRVYKIYFFGLEIPLGIKPDKYKNEFSFKKKLSISSHAMPIGLFYTDYTNTLPLSHSLTQKEIEMICLSRYLSDALFFTETRQVIDTETRAESKNNACEITGKFNCYENITDYSNIEIDKSATPIQ